MFYKIITDIKYFLLLKDLSLNKIVLIKYTER